MVDSVSMPDVEILRLLMLELEDRQVSPRATVVIVIRDEADYLDCDIRTVEDGLRALQDLDYIEGPGADVEGIWLFRKLTSKGARFVRQARDEGAWEAMKRLRARRMASS